MPEVSSCKFSVDFEIDGHEVSKSHFFRHEPQEDLADKGWVFGNLFVEVASALRPHLNGEEWDCFVRSIASGFKEMKREEEILLDSSTKAALKSL